jgi:uncharacterized protein (TIGR02118 family)
MYQVSAFYQHPQDPAAFDDYYLNEYCRIAARLPGLIHMTLSWPQPGDDGAPPPFYLVTLMYWADKDAALAALGGPVGAEAADSASRFGGLGPIVINAEGSAKVAFVPRAPDTPYEIHSILGLYEFPPDPSEFDKHYRTVHSELAAKMPGLAGFTVSWTQPASDGTPAPYYLIGAQEWLTNDSLGEALSSPEAAAAIADLDNFAGVGMSMLICRSMRVV